MADISVAITKISDKVIELRTVVKGKLYTKRYMGFPTKNALAHFEKWIKSQENL